MNPSLEANPLLSQWLGFDPDGTVRVMTGKVELGQGILTALAQIAADELDVALERVRVVPASTDVSPDERYTAGSHSIDHSGEALRLVCAEVRALLRGAGLDDYRKLGDLLDRPVTGDVPPKPPGERRLIGAPAARVDLPDKFAGRPAYVCDLALPGMLHARVVRPSGPGAVLVEVPEPPTGVTLVQDGSFLAVVAAREETAVAAAVAVARGTRWEKGFALPDEDDLAGFFTSAPAEQRVVAEVGTAAPPVAHTARYTRPYVAHASIGPACAVARWDGDGHSLHVWGATQGIFPHRGALARAFDMDPHTIVVTHVDGPGCYGHNGADDAMFEAALIARSLPGRPVRLQWSREDELAWAPFGSGGVVELAADLDAAGRVTAWRHEHWSNGFVGRPSPGEESPRFGSAPLLAEPFERPVSVDPLSPEGGSDRNAVPYYAFPSVRVVANRLLEMPLRTSSLRSLGAHLNVFAIESFMDELAAAAGADPFLFRLQHLGDDRARELLGAAAAKARWRAEPGRSQGIAFARYKNLAGYCAVVAEVEAVHEIRVRRLTVAADIGMVVNPDGARNQIEGGAVQAVSWTLKERVRFDRERVTSTTWESYPILRFSEVPEVDVVLIDRPDAPPLGAGEITMGPVAAAVANAVAHAIGVRARDMPLTPDHVVRAMG